jgi:hypothetical protein
LDPILPYTTRSGLANPVNLYVVNIGFFSVATVGGTLASQNCFFTKGFKVEEKGEYQIIYQDLGGSCGLVVSKKNSGNLEVIPTQAVSLHNAFGPQRCEKTSANK